MFVYLSALLLQHHWVAVAGSRLLESAGNVGSHNMFGPGGPKFSDVRQGTLGDCFWLAAIASVSHHQPHLIQDMVEVPLKEQEAYPVHVVRFMLAGKTFPVAVDEMMPVWAGTMMPKYATLRKDQNFWPLIFEKAFAKLFGSFRSIESGQSSEAFKAIVQAPVDYIAHANNRLVNNDKVWDELLEAAKQGYPMVASSEADTYGIADHHAYAVLNVSTTEVNGKKERTIRLFNPWHQSKYRGKVPNPGSAATGDFRMLLEEYVESFSRTAVAKVKPSYVMSYTILSTGANRMLKRVQFEAANSKPFAVQLEWPDKRISRRGNCDVLDPRTYLQITTPEGMSLRSSHSDPMRRAMEMSNVRVDLPGSIGTYFADIEIHFPQGEWVDEVVLNTYASEDLKIVEAVSWPDQPPGLDATGSMTWVELGGFENRKVNGIYEERHSFEFLAQARETYWHKDYWLRMPVYVDSTFLYWCEADRRWQVAEAGQLEEVRKGGCPALAKAQPGDDVLSPDLPKNFQVPVDKLWMKVRSAGVVRNSNTEIMANSLIEERTAGSCREVLDRMQTLNNADDIAAKRFDELFPPDYSSIAEPGDRCGDKARQQDEECRKMSEWAALSDIVAFASAA